jgi:hypothetical protein
MRAAVAEYIAAAGSAECRGRTSRVVSLGVDRILATYRRYHVDATTTHIDKLETRERT